MGTAFGFCGECGKPVKDGAGFCGECGAAVAQPPSREQNRARKPRVTPPAPDKQSNASTQAKIPSPVSAASSDAPSDSYGFLVPNALLSGVQWMAIWLICWLPVGLIFASLYNFDSHWGDDYLLAYGIGSSLSGFLAGLSIYFTLKRKKASIGFSGIVPGGAGAMIWAVGLLPLSLFLKDDDPLILALLVLALVFGVLVSRLSITQLEKKYNFVATIREKNLVAMWWVLCAFLGVSVIISVWMGLW